MTPKVFIKILCLGVYGDIRQHPVLNIPSLNAVPGTMPLSARGRVAARPPNTG
jgi:hypothetical protein